MTFPQYQPLYGNPYAQRMEPQTYLPQAQPMQQMPASTQGAYLKGRPVTSEEEARGIPVDFDGSVMVFPDAAHGMIYTKQLNMQDGSAIFRRYVLAEMPPMAQSAPPAPKEYAEKHEVAELRQTIAQIQAAINSFPKRGKRKELIENDESDDANSGDC